MTTQTTEPTFTGWRKAKGLGFGWLSPVDTAVIAVLVVVWLGALMLAGWRAGVAVLPLVLIGLGLTVPFDGLPARWYVAREWRWRVTGRHGHRPYRSGVVSPVDGMPELPGPLASTRLVEVSAGVGVGSRWGVIWHRGRSEVTATLEVTTQQAHLADPDEFIGWVANWHRWLAATCTDQAVTRVAVVVDSSSVSGDALGEHIRASVDPEAPPFAAEVLGDLAAREHHGSTSVAVFVEITFGVANLGGKRRPIDEQVAEVARTLGGLEDGLRGCGVGSVRRASPERLAERLRAAWDPAAAGAAEVARRAGDPLEWRRSGPVAADEQRGAVLLDSGAAHGWVWAEAPRSPVTARVLSRLVDPGPYPKRVTLVWQPMAPAAAVAKLEAERTAASAKAQLAERQKRDETARGRQDRELAETAAVEEASGAGLGTLWLYVAVTVPHLDALPDAIADVEARAGQARIRLRRATCSHAAVVATGLGAGVYPADLATGWNR